MTARLPEYAALLRVAGRLFLPAFLGQAAVIFTLFHVFTYMGMCVHCFFLNILFVVRDVCVCVP